MLLFIAACSPVAHQALRTETPSARVVYIVNHGWHAGLALRVDDIPEGVLPEREDFPDARYLEIGWGERDFYQAPDFSFWLMLKAGLWPTASVLLVEPLYESPRGRYPCSNVVELKLTQDRFLNLLEYVSASLDRRASVRAAALPPPYPQPGRFYPAKGRFHTFNTCNTWTSRALAAAGVPVRSPHPFTAGGLLSNARHFGRMLEPAPGCRRD